ncbi:MAG: polysaccharide biosynthesis protein [Ekhidna sp.]|uniref:polysaccharide biosynthesis protein n=1 Tax=Ekhidna sp. TaxID=2608089 RepID=UPI0032F06A74
MTLEGKNVLITGGTGSFGKAYARHILENYRLNKLVLFSRDEQKHYVQKREFLAWGDKVQFVIGDIRDRDKVFEVCRGMDVVIHSAAMKHMPMAEEHPMEAIKTNVLGSQNLIDACVFNGVKKVVALSTDKAALPINVYGGTKLLLERLFITANAQHGQNTSFAVVRYANVFGSKGSVIPLFMKLKDSGELPITHPEMTRFSITMEEGIALIQFAIERSLGGEIIVPIAPSYKVGDVAEAVCPDCEKKIIGPRVAEKMHEVLVSEFEAKQTIKARDYYIIVPELGIRGMADYLNNYKGQKAPISQYDSGSNSDWLSVEGIIKLISET